MRRLREWIVRIGGLFNKQRKDLDLDEEIESHLQLHIEDNLRLGMTHEEARRQAMIKLGGIESTKEAYRDQRGLPFLETLWQDVRYGARMLRKNPGFTSVAVLTLALGIGANTAIFSLIDTVLLKTLPVKNPKELVLFRWVSWKLPLGTTQTGYSDEDKTGRQTSPSFSYPAFERFRAQNQIFSTVFGFAPLGFDKENVNVNISGQASLAAGEAVTGGYFSGLGVQPIKGRTITDEDEKADAPRVAVISFGYWTRQFGHDTSAVGKAITLNGMPFTIVGVTPPEFFGVEPGRAPDLWIPIADQAGPTPWEGRAPGNRSLFMATDWWWLMVSGRLRPDVSEQRARATLDAFFQQSVTSGLESTLKPEDLPHLELIPASKGLDNLQRSFSKPLFILMTVVGLVLLIACANVATLLLARATARQKEFGLRLALGASKARLIRQLLTESVVLAGIGGALGILFAYWGSHALLPLMSSRGQPTPLEIHPDLIVLGFTLAISVLTGILFGLAPAFRATQVEVTPALKESAGSVLAGGRGARLGLGNVLVIAQIATSLPLLIGAGLFVRTLAHLENQDLGFNQKNLLLFQLDPARIGYNGQRLVNLYSQLRERLQALPGVKSASLSAFALLSGWRNSSPISIEGDTPKPGQNTRVWWNKVGPAFFETMGIRVTLGRGIEERDTASSPKVAVVNEVMARHFFGEGNPMGRRFSFGESRGANEQFEIVGVVQNAKFDNLREAPPPTVYVPYPQMTVGRMHVAVRTAGDPGVLIPTVRRLVHEMDSNLPLYNVKTQAEQIDESLVQERLFARLSSFFGVLTLVLACLGLHGLLAYTVNWRTREFGIRMALGAQRVDVLKLVIQQGLGLTLAGLATGLLGALSLTRLVSSFLFGVSATDPITFAAVTTLLAAVALIACYLPARRATKVDPMVALRYE